MATRQGLTGSLTQYGDDTRRALINNAVPTSMFSHRWFSNMNTTCTIKSAPPRTPEVMNLLSSKHGWLFKRNEQGVWQRRYCCVVPHTFLYYFDSEPQQPNDSSLQYQGDGTSNINDATPVGIIDLECYSHVNRLSVEDNIMELKGDSITNPDLRSFLFKGENKKHCEEWTSAFLTDRHQALRDEREALRDVCDSFPLQLANMNNMIKEAEAKAEEKQSETYRIRSLMEEGRKQILTRVREGLEALPNITSSKHSIEERSSSNTNNLRRMQQQQNLKEDKATLSFKTKIQQHQAASIARLDSLDTHRFMGDAVESVSVLVELVNTIIAEYQESYLQSYNLSQYIHLKSKTDNEQLQQQLSELEKSSQQREASLEKNVSELEATVQKLSKENADLTSMLTNMQLETSIHAKNNKEKLAVLSEHKKILKKEVIDLRAALEEIKSELDVVSHQKAQLEGRYKREKSRRAGLQENYQVLREQLSVQERVWGMMQSSLAGGSVVFPSDSISLPGGTAGNTVQFDGGAAAPNVKTGSTTRNSSSKGIGVTNVAFHPRDVVVKRRINEEKGDDDQLSRGSRGSRGSWHSGKSLADEDDSDSSATGSRTDSDGGRRRQNETRSSAAPPRHPNPTTQGKPRHNRAMSRCDASVMSEITTDRDIATHNGDVNVDDPIRRSKPTSTIVIDNDVILHDMEQGMTPKRSIARTLQTIPSASSASVGNSPESEDAGINYVATNMTSPNNGDIITNQSSDDSLEIRVIHKPSKSSEEPKNNETSGRSSLFSNPALCGIDLGGDSSRFASSSGGNSSALASLVNCVPLSACEDDTENEDREGTARKGTKQRKEAEHNGDSSPLPPHSRTPDASKEKRERPPPSATRKVAQALSAVLTKSSLDALLADSDAASVASVASHGSRKSSVVINSGVGYVMPGLKFEGTNSKLKDADTSSVVSTGSTLTPSRKLSIAERARVEADNHIRSIMVSSPSRTPSVDTTAVSTSVKSVSESNSSSVEQHSKENNTTSATKNEMRRAGPPHPVGSSSSWISALGNKLVDTIDHSVLGIKTTQDQQHGIRRSNSYQEQQQPLRRTSSSGSLSVTAKSVDTRRAQCGYESEASVETAKVDLKERQRIQRERQLQFLKERGLIKQDG